MQGFVLTYDVLSKLYNKAEADKKELKRQLQSARDKFTATKHKEKSLGKSNVGLQDEITVAEENKEENETQIRCLKKRISDLEEREDKLLKQIDDFVLDTKEYYKAYLEADANRKLHKDILGLLVNPESLKNDNECFKAVESAINTMKEAQDQTQGKVQMMMIDRETLKRSVKVLMTESDSYKGQVEEVKASRDLVEKRNKAETDKQQQLERQLSGVTSSLDAANSEAEKLKLSLDSAKATIMNAAENRRIVASEVTVLKEEVMAFINQFHQVIHEKEELSRANAQLTKEMEIARFETKEQIKEKLKVNAQLKRELKMARFEGKKQINQKKIAILDLQEQVERLKNENGQLKRKKGFFRRIFGFLRRRLTRP